ncbi:uncharacterized protein LOC107042010 isoform X3 [Diachasma alloeum]|nr:uncharacterized protein LOC107042010 isoform X3 [Diachasma alloeum]XP_015118350.1 uncharacterized protein LOC107042010 isoform X3 [Diachasma alloeum]
MSSEERSAYYSNESSLDDAQISCNILEAYGGEVPSNKAIEDHFKTKQKITSEGPKSRVDQWLYAFEHNSRQNPLAEPFPFIINSCYSTKRNGSSSRKSKSKKQKRDDCEKHAQEVFSKNILMRHILLEKQLESMSLESSSSSTSGKDHDSDCTRNSCEFVEMPDDPDVLLRPGMMGKGILEGRPIDDGYRFAHRGVKETITPRRYLMDHVDDDEFIFKKKLCLISSGLLHQSHAFILPTIDLFFQ